MGGSGVTALYCTAGYKGEVCGAVYSFSKFASTLASPSQKWEWGILVSGASFLSASPGYQSDEFFRQGSRVKGNLCVIVKKKNAVSYDWTEWFSLALLPYFAPLLYLYVFNQLTCLHYLSFVMAKRCLFVVFRLRFEFYLPLSVGYSHRPVSYIHVYILGSTQPTNLIGAMQDELVVV
jgi:hypothetical protein